jgi:hypothetical protein
MMPGLQVDDSDTLERFLKAITNRVRDARVVIGRHVGIEVLRKADDGGMELRRQYIVGDTVVLLMVTASEEVFDEELALEFMDSFTFTMPWLIHASDEGRYSVAFPKFARRITASELGLPEGAVGSGVTLGGQANQVLVVGVIPRGEDALAQSPEQLLDATAEALAQGGQIRSRSSITYQGVPGSELEGTIGDAHLRARYLVGRTHLFYLAVVSSEQGALRSAESEKFFRSLRWQDDR